MQKNAREHKKIRDRKAPQTPKKVDEETLRQSEEKYRSLFNAIDEGFFLIDVISDEKDNPVDLLYVEANAAATRIVGLDYTGKRLTEISPNYEPYWFEIFGNVAKTGECAPGAIRRAR